MKKLSLILFSFVLMFSFADNVLGEDRIPGTFGDVDSYPPKDLNPAKYYNYIPYANNATTFAGVRMSFVDNKGNLITYRDYSNQTIVRYDKVFATNSLFVKTEYTNGNTPVFIPKNLTKVSLYQKFSKLEPLLESYHFNVPDFKNNVKNVTNIKLSFFEDMFAKKNHNDAYDYESDLKGILIEFGLEDYLTPEKLKDLFMVVEPTSVFILEGRPFYGTVYELSIQAQKTDGDPAARYYDSCKRQGKNALCDFGNALKINLPCSATLSGSLIGKVEDSGFSNKKYFGSINILSNAGTTCSESEFDYLEVVKPYGIGMGVVWFYDYFDFKTEPTCQYVKNLAISNGIISPFGIPACSSVSSIVNNYNRYKDEMYDTIDINWWYEQKVKGDSYCNCETPVIDSGYNCSPQKDVYTCEPGQTTVEYQDYPTYVDVNSEEYWENCIYDEGSYDDEYHKTSSDGAWSYKEDSLGSKYCPVYCVEELTANFSSNEILKQTGRHFTFSDFGESIVTGSRRCQTKTVDWNGFKDDLAAQNNAIKDAYVNYLIALEKERANGDGKRTDTCCSHSYKWEEETVEENVEECVEENKTLKIPYMSGLTKIVCEKIIDEKEPDEPTDEKFEEIPDEEIGDPVEEDVKYKKITYKSVVNKCEEYYYDYTTKSVYLNRIREYKGDTKTTCGSSSSAFYTISSGYYENQYRIARNTYDQIIDNMKSCYEWGADSIYNIDGKATISYDGGRYYYNELELDSEITYGDILELKSSPSLPDSVVFTRTKCEGDRCFNGESYTVLRYDQVVKERYGTQKFYLSDDAVDAYKYVSKLNNLSSFTSANLDKDIYIGAHFPVSMDMKQGYYDISIQYDHLGHISSSRSVVSEILDATPNDYGAWECKYRVYDELIVDGDLKVIYRPIDLNNPFPDITAGGRVTGSNWCDGDYCGTDSRNRVVTNVITSKKDIYSKKPMYTFILNSSDIMRIRSYNKSTDSFGNKRTYDDFNLTCAEGTGNGCISEFLTNIMESDPMDNGACEFINRTYPTDDVFDSCRYQSR